MNDGRHDGRRRAEARVWLGPDAQLAHTIAAARVNVDNDNRRGVRLLERHAVLRVPTRDLAVGRDIAEVDHGLRGSVFLSPYGWTAPFNMTP